MSLASILAARQSSNVNAGLPGLVKSLNTQVQSNPGQTLVPKQITGYAIATESLTDNGRTELDNAQQSLDSLFQRIAVESFADHASKGAVKSTLSATQINAGFLAGMMAGDIGAWLRVPVKSGRIAQEGLGNVTYVDNQGSEFFGERPRAALEAYDEREAKTTQIYSIAYNMMAARQDEFGEAWFPTVVVSPESAGFSVTTRIVSVFREIRHAIDASTTNFNKRNILEAAVDGSILRNDQTKVTPVYRDETAVHFVSPTLLAPRDLLVDDVAVSTSALKIGAKFSLVGISQTDALLATGMMDSTDAIDTGLRLASIYVKVTDGNSANDEVLKFNVSTFQGATAVAAQQGNYRLAQINFPFATLKVDKNTKKVNGAASTLLANVTTNSNTVRLSGSVFGQVNLETGATEMQASPTVTVASVSNIDGELLALDAGAGLAVANLFANASIVGYDLEANRTNSNRRQRGQLLVVDMETQAYSVQLRSPITVPRPVASGDFNDTSDLSALITATNLRTSIGAVDSLLAARDGLKEFISNDQTLAVPEALGVGRHLVKAVYSEDTLAVDTKLDSLKSSDRAADIQALLVNKIRDMVYNMYRDSRYKVAADARAGGQAPMPTVLIGTDPVLARYLIVEGDFRTLSNEFNVKIVSTNNSKMKGQIAISFGDFSNADSGVVNPLHFGCMAWKPEITTVLQVTRNGATSKELSVMPAFLHIQTLPVLGWLTVTGISAIAAGKATVNMRTIA